MDNRAENQMRQDNITISFPEVSKVSRNHPGHGIPVTDWFIRGTLHRDGVVVFPFASKSKSVDVIMYTILCCNGVQRKNQSFTFFVSICPKDGKLGNSVFNYIQQNTLLTGLEGCYFYANDQWNHLMFGECGLVCDYAAHTEIAGHSSSSANDPCLWCHVLKRPFNPFTFNYQLDLSFAPNFIQKTLPSSLNFLHPHSVYRLISYLYHRFSKVERGKVIKVLKERTEETDNDLSSLCGELLPLLRDSLSMKEFQSLLSILSSVDPNSSVFWHPIVLSEVANVHLACVQILQAYKDLSRCISFVSLIELLSDDCGSVPDLKEKDTTESVLSKCPSVISKRITQKKEKPQSRGIDQKKITFLHESGYFLIDPMHAFSNAFIRMANVIFNRIKKKASTRDATTRNTKLFVNTFVFYNRNTLTKMPGTVGSVVTSMAALRLQEIGSIPSLRWVHPKILNPGEFEKLTSEQRITFYFCFFGVVYRDSIRHPIIYAISHIIPLVGEMVVFRRDRVLLATLQARLSLFLNILEQNCREDAPAECLHLLNHLYDDIIRGGEKSAIANFITERLYHLAKVNGVACQYSIHNLSKRIGTLSITSFVTYMNGENKWELKASDKWMMKEIQFCLPAEEMESIEMSLLADYQFYSNDSLMVLTYLDELLSRYPNLVEWKQRNNRFELKREIALNSILYSQITWNNKVYKSLPVVQTGITLNSLKESSSCIGYKLGYNRTLLVFAVLGYKMVSVNGYPYPMAVCAHLPVSSLSSQSFTYHTVVVEKKGLPPTPQTVLVPLCQLFMGMISLYQDKERLVLTPGKIWIFQTHCILPDEMFESLRNKSSFVCYYSLTQSLSFSSWVFSGPRTCLSFVLGSPASVALCVFCPILLSPINCFFFGTIFRLLYLL